jgi:hypothetical protein
VAPSSKPASSNHSVESRHLVTVPHIKPYVSVERAKRRLEDVGLVGVLREPPGPYYFVATRPKGGTRVQVGSEVRLLVGDG